METMREKFRPKHQVLVLKCYPRFQKNAAEVKPNSSELSYLLYYASTRRSKLPKVGEFLEKKTERDVWRNKITNVQVTLQILSALIDKCPGDLPLYSSSVFSILNTILNSHDVNLVEASVEAFVTFCEHYDSATVSTDSTHRRQYDEVVESYAMFASKDTQVKVKNRTVDVPVALRFRSAGLRAVKGLVSSDSFGMDPGELVRVVMPAILHNLLSEKASYLTLLQDRENILDQAEKDYVLRRRQSISGQRPPTEANEPDREAAFGTTADADERAEEEVGVVALQSLRQIFSATNRGQLRAATNAVLAFATSHDRVPAEDKDAQLEYLNDGSWTTELFELISHWAPVQDRFIILVASVEALVRSPIIEEDLPNQLTLTALIDWLLRSDVNFIGLSVIDVLVGLIQHLLLLLQLGGPGSQLYPHHQQDNAIDNAIAHKERQSSRGESADNAVVMRVVAKASLCRIQTLDSIQRCIGDLATHVYYSDQITDMVAALLSRLKPTSFSGSISSPVAAIEDPASVADTIAEVSQLKQKPNTDGLFSFDTARSIALQCVKDIIVVANSHRKDGGNAVDRARVAVSVWEGTQWLLRDPHGRVRKAFVDALLTWLQYEVDRKDLRLVEEHIQVSKSGKKDAEQTNGGKLARRAISNASQRPKVPARVHSSFLQLLHLAIYENALQYAGSEPDVLLLHLLLTRLAQKLGVNSVRSGLPMIFRLQEDVETLQNQSSKVALGSLVYGYFWALSEIFEFETSPLGQRIHQEIARRRDEGRWVNSIRMPPIAPESLVPPAQTASTISLPKGIVHEESILTTESRQEMVDSIADAYADAIVSPPQSPPVSPNRTASAQFIRTTSSANAPQLKDRTLPNQVKEQMLSEWSKEMCASSMEHDKRSDSVSGSKTNSSGTQKYLAANGPFIAGASPGSATPENRHRHHSPRQVPSMTGLNNQETPESSRTPLSESSAPSVVGIEELKQVLSGQHFTRRLPAPMSNANLETDDGTGSESMVTAPSTSPSDASLPIHTEPANATTAASANAADKPPPSTPPNFSRPNLSPPSRDGPSSLPSKPIEDASDKPKPKDLEPIPPVPLLPANLRAPALGSPFTAGVERELQASKATPHSSARTSRESSRQALGFSSWSRHRQHGDVKAGVDLKALLDSIDVSSSAREERGRGTRVASGIGRPPY